MADIFLFPLNLLNLKKKPKEWCILTALGFCISSLSSPSSSPSSSSSEMPASSLFLSSPLHHSFRSSSHNMRNNSGQWLVSRRARISTVRSSDEKDGKDTDSPAFNPFGFVTDNPSSRSAIQLPENPAEDGN
ncbi:hypothetical protein CRG98_031099, partial [Punica granatum]